MKAPYSVFLLSVSLGFTGVLQAQTADSQQLAKYSYPIFVVSHKQQYTGTGFFYRSGDTTYLVSNYHAIKGMSPMKRAITFSSDTLFLKYPLKESPGFNVMPIDISEKVTGETEVFSMVDRIDLYKIPVQLPDDASIFFINDLIDEAYFDAIPEEVVAFGFPTQPGSVPAFYSQQQRLEGRVNPQGFDDYDATLRFNYSDSARAILGGTARYYYFIRPFAAQGYSGSPVFGKFRTTGNEIVYRFTGVIFAGQPATQQTWAIRGDVALQYLQGE